MTIRPKLSINVYIYDVIRDKRQPTFASLNQNNNLGTGQVANRATPWADKIGIAKLKAECLDVSLTVLSRSHCLCGPASPI